jgi:putative transposase
MLIEMQPKRAVAQTAERVKGERAISITRMYMERKQNFTGENFRAKGYYKSTAGRDEESVKKHIWKQEAEDKRLDQLELFKDI